MGEIVPTLTLICAIFRVICWLILAVIAVLYIGILWRRKVFHSNLQLLLFAMPFTYLVFIIPSAVNLIVPVIGVKLPADIQKILSGLTDFGLFGSSFNLFSFTIERLIATWRVDDYEHISSRIPYIALFLMCLQWSIAALIITLHYLQIIEVWPLLTVIGIQWAISVVLFIALPGISRRAYQKKIKNRATKYGSRYQSVENVRTAMVLHKLVLFLAISLAFQLSYYSLSWYIIPKDINPPINQIFHASAAIIPSIGCFLVVYYHPNLRSLLPRIMRSRVYAQEASATHKETTTSSSDPAVQIRSFSGTNLVVRTENHRETYFAEFKRQWS